MAIRIDLTRKRPWDDDPQVMSCDFWKELDRHLESELFKSMQGVTFRLLGVQSVETRWAQVGIRDAFAAAGPHRGTGSCRHSYLGEDHVRRPSPHTRDRLARDLRELKINVLRRDANAKGSTQPLTNVGCELVQLLSHGVNSKGWIPTLS